MKTKGSFPPRLIKNQYFYSLAPLRSETMRLLNYFFFMLLSCITTNHYSQVEGNIWYFGDNAGLDFNSGTPVAITNSAMVTQEGCATISDANGDLLFYTDGSTVFTRFHAPMPNGIGLMGNSSSTQSAVIIPPPNTPDEFFIFTVDNLGQTDGLRYSTVDMNQNTGAGDVISINVPLLGSSTEKITAINHQNRLDFWVIGHEWNSNAFYAWKVTSAGVDPIPVISNAGPIHAGPNGNTLGYMKASPNGDKIALAITLDGHFEIYDFDNTTGAITNPIILSTPAYGSAYGVEFSPDGNLLYGTVNIAPSNIFQWDLLLGSQTAILASEVIIGTSSSSSVGALQLASDNKIYLSRNNSSRLGVITSPNQYFTPGYSDNGPALSGKIARLGLPTFIQSLFNTPQIQSYDTCLGFTSNFSLSSNLGLDSLNWDFGDPNNTSNTSTLFTPSHTFGDSGEFAITCIYFYGALSDTLNDTVHITMPPVIDLGPDQTICDGTPVVLNATFPNVSYLWSGGSTNPDLLVNTSNEYSVVVTNICGQDEDTVLILFSESPSVNLGEDDSLCKGDFFLLDVSNTGDSYIWQDSSNQSNFLITEPGTYFVEVTNFCGSASDSITILKDNCFFDLYIPSSFTPNGDGINDLFFDIENNVELTALHIFDRWGNLVYVFSSSTDSWDGKVNGRECQEGVYIWTAEARDLKNRTFKRQGTVTLIR